jgi:hypothetical protein
MPITSESTHQEIATAYETATSDDLKFNVLRDVVQHSTTGHLNGLISAHIDLLDKCTSEQIKNLIALAPHDNARRVLFNHYRNRMRQLKKDYFFKKLEQLLNRDGIVVETVVRKTASSAQPQAVVETMEEDDLPEEEGEEEGDGTDSRFLMGPPAANAAPVEEVERRDSLTSLDAADSLSGASASSDFEGEEGEEDAGLAAGGDTSPAFNFLTTDISNDKKLTDLSKIEDGKIKQMIHNLCVDKSPETILKLLSQYGNAIQNKSRKLLDNEKLQVLMSALITEAGNIYKNSPGGIPKGFRTAVRRAIEPGKRGATRRTLSGLFHKEGSDNRKWYNTVVDSLKREDAAREAAAGAGAGGSSSDSDTNRVRRNSKGA